MPKTIKNVFSEIASFENIHRAYINARRDKRYREEILRFSAHLIDNLHRIQKRLLSGDFRPGAYREFYIYEPKCRLIMAQPFEDRVIQWAFYQVLNPRFVTGYISDSYACIPGRGQIAAVERLYYWLKLVDRPNNVPCYPMNTVFHSLTETGWQSVRGEGKLSVWTHPGFREILLNATAEKISIGDLQAVARKSRIEFPDAPEGPKWYYLKLDISKYFYRISHDVALREFNRKVSDKQVQAWMAATVCNNNRNFGLPAGMRPEEVPRNERIPDRGMPVGSLSSQMLANLNLNPLDQYAKRELGIRYYIRYMDDVIILSDDKQQLKVWKETLERFINERLLLDLNNKVCIRPISLGIEFCGFRLWSNHVKLRKSTALRMRRKLRALMEDYRNGEITLERAKMTISAYEALLKHCNSYSLRKRIFGEYTETEWTEGWFSLQRNSTSNEESDE
jgi:retron-type reverse transcriptase